MSEIEFDKYARKGAYHWRDYYGGLLRMNAGTKARYDTVVECLGEAGVAAGMRVIDVGCGDGALAGVIRKAVGCTVTGVDPNATAIEAANGEFSRRGLSGNFLCAEGYRYPFADGFFDAAVCSDVIEHVREPKSLLTEIRRLLRPGGVLVISTPIRITERPLDRLHVQEWFEDEFIALCRPFFGAPIAVKRTHPVFWYEAYVLPGSWFSRSARLLVNALTKMCRNPFLDRSRPWRCYTTQTLVLRRDAAPATKNS